MGYSARDAAAGGRSHRERPGGLTAKSADYRVGRPVLLWFNGTMQGSASQFACHAGQYFQVAECPVCIELLPSEIERLNPRILCFDFDFPDRKRLRAMQCIKQQHASILVLMLTTEHSEALAVWAFRARVWNYLVKPVPLAELDMNLRRLSEITSADRTTAPSVLPPEQDVPEDVRVEDSRCAKQKLLPAIFFIKSHYHRALRVEEIAAACGMSGGSFSRAFRATYGLPVTEYVVNYRIGEARRMLRRPRVSITDVAYATGFSDHAYFDRVFKAHVGVTPSTYARSTGHLED